jgi:DNA-binding LytR/AlgR family response regulator
MKCIVIEDSDLAMFTMVKFIEKSDSLKLIETFNSPIKAIDWLKKNKVELIFLDLELPELKGFEFLELINTSDYHIIVTTSHSEHAADSYNYNIIDYLVKPFTFNRFTDALAKIQNKIKSTKTNNNDVLYIRKGASMVKVNINEILWMESSEDYVSIQTEKEKFMVLSTLTAMEEKLNDDFMRIHRSFIIRLDKINSLEDSCIQIKDKLIPIGKTYKEAVLQKLNIL